MLLTPTGLFWPGGISCRPVASRNPAERRATCLARGLLLSPRITRAKRVEFDGQSLRNPYREGARVVRFRLFFTFLLIPLLLAAFPARAQVRIKDIADVEGVRANQLIGYGLVVGLNGTGDKLDSAIFTRESLIGMLERLGVNTRDQVQKLSTKNIAAVMVTAELPAFARGGSRIDVSVSALGDATNLTGGTLLVTPLLAADGDVYAVAQGAIATGAVSARGGSGSSVTRGVPTAGRIANGGTVEKEIGRASCRERVSVLV